MLPVHLSSTLLHARQPYQVDLVEQMGPLPFNLEFFTECQDMRQLLAYLDAPPNTGQDEVDAGAGDDAQEENVRSNDLEGSAGPVGRLEGGEEVAGTEVADKAHGVSGGGGGRRGNERFRKMTEEICDVVDSYGLVCFYPLNIQVTRPPFLDYALPALSRHTTVMALW